MVFCQPTGKSVDPHRDWEDWKELLKAAGVRDVRVHDARHTMASLLLEHGVPLRVAMEILGHASIQLTSDTYSHVAPELAEDAAKRMGEALWD
ncbi:MAG: tyrosine-type recombinase/integrase [Mycobacteriales bacterium]